jgi:hypothetical protein
MNPLGASCPENTKAPARRMESLVVGASRLDLTEGGHGRRSAFALGVAWFGNTLHQQQQQQHPYMCRLYFNYLCCADKH